MRENLMKKLVIALLLVAIVGVVGSQSVYAQTAPTSNCHWWNSWTSNCRNHNGNGGYNGNNGHYYGSYPSYNSQPYQCNPAYQNCQACNGAEYCYQGYGTYPSYQYGGQCGTPGYYYCSTSPSYSPSYPSYPSYQQPCTVACPYTGYGSPYYQQQQVSVSVPGELVNTNISFVLIPSADQSCYIALTGIYTGQYLNQQVTVTGLATPSNSVCQYTGIDVSSVTPLYQQQAVLQQTTTAAPTTETQTQTTTVTQQAQTPLATPTVDYTPTILTGLFALAAIALIGYFVLRLRGPTPVPAPTNPQPTQQ